MNKDGVIRRAKIHDVDALVKLIGILFAIETDFTINTEQQQKGLFLMLKEPERCCIMVYELKDQVVGMCTGQLMVSTAEGGLKVIVEDLVVAEKQRGNRIGSRLVEAVEKWAKGCGAKRMDLLADQRNRSALDFYCRREWQRTELVALQKLL